jgi:hypothetical protein
MGDKIAVPRQELTEMLGLPADATDEQISAAMDEVAAAGEALQAERQLEAEDVRIVAAAIRDARITAERHETWLNALRLDRASNRALLNSLGAGIPTEATSRAARAFLTARSPRASANPASAVADLHPVVTTADAMNAGIEADPEFHRALWNMGVRSGLSKPPEQITYWSDPNAPQLVTNGDGTGQWVDPGCEQRDASMRQQLLREKALREQQEERDKQSRAALIEDRRKWEW